MDIICSFSCSASILWSDDYRITLPWTETEESEKVGLQLNIQKMKIMASGPITSWQIYGQTVETVLDFILGGSKISADGDCSHEIKRRSLLGRKVMTKLDSIFKSRDVTLPTKVHLVKAMVFPVVMYWCEGWTVKKAEHWRIDAFELWCWRRLLRVPWTARKSNQSIHRRSVLGVHLKDWCWSWNSIPLATSREELTHLRKAWCWERVRAGEWTTENEMIWWHHWLNGHGFGWTPGVDGGQGGLACCDLWSHKESDTTERLNWTDLHLLLGRDI